MCGFEMWRPAAPLAIFTAKIGGNPKNIVEEHFTTVCPCREIFLDVDNQYLGFSRPDTKNGTKTQCLPSKLHLLEDDVHQLDDLYKICVLKM